MRPLQHHWPVLTNYLRQQGVPISISAPALYSPTLLRYMSIESGGVSSTSTSNSNGVGLGPSTSGTSNPLPSLGAGAAAAAPRESYYQQFRTSIKKYGYTGIATYLVLSTSVTIGFYVAIENNFDVIQLLGLESTQAAGALSKGSSLALAILCSKMCIPIKAPLAAFLTPYIFRLKERLVKGVVKAQ